MGKAAKNNVKLRGMTVQVLHHRGYGAVYGLQHRITIDAATDRGKGNGGKPIFIRKSKSSLVTVRQQRFLVMIPAPPYRANSVENIFGGEIKAGSHLHLSSGAASQGATGGLKLIVASGAMNSPIDTTAPRQPLVSGIDYSVDLKLRNISLDHPELALARHNLNLLS
jgi:hypothetical protein